MYSIEDPCLLKCRQFLIIKLFRVNVEMLNILIVRRQYESHFSFPVNVFNKGKLNGRNLLLESISRDFNIRCVPTENHYFPPATYFGIVIDDP